jgi:hypothetical protein
LNILFDHNVNRHFARHLKEQNIKTAREMGWDKLVNGELLAAAAEAEFEALLSLDKNLRHQQNLNTLPIAIVVLDSVSNALSALIPFATHAQTLFAGTLEKCFYLIKPDGQIIRLGNPSKS